MKKRLLTIFGLIMTLAITLSIPFSCTKKSHIEALANIEERFEDVTDLISINPDYLSGATIQQGCTPFDSETKNVMPGASVLPNHDEYGQVKSSTYLITPFTPTLTKSVYVWVYLAGRLSFELTVELNDGTGNRCYWEFDDGTLYNYGIGWKLLELSFSDCEIECESFNILDKTFSQIRFIYKSGADEYATTAEEYFSFYHVFLAKSYVGQTDAIYKLERVYYKLKENYFKNNAIYKGDEVFFQAPDKVFEYVYIGKYDLVNYLNTGAFSWEIEITNPIGAKKTLDFGDKYTFESEGWFNISIKLYEQKTFTKEVILSDIKSVNAINPTIGNFTMGSTYSMLDNENIIVTFKLSDNMVLRGDLSFSLDNNNAEIVTYYEQNGMYFVEIKANKKGKVVLNVSAAASTENNNFLKTYTKTATITIQSSEKKIDVNLIILWVTFAIFCVFLLIYMAKTLVQARKNDVK